MWKGTRQTHRIAGHDFDLEGIWVCYPAAIAWQHYATGEGLLVLVVFGPQLHCMAPPAEAKPHGAQCQLSVSTCLTQVHSAAPVLASCSKWCFFCVWAPLVPACGGQVLTSQTWARSRSRPGCTWVHTPMWQICQVPACNHAGTCME
jgi:hypothetical protein